MSCLNFNKRVFYTDMHLGLRKASYKVKSIQEWNEMK